MLVHGVKGELLTRNRLLVPLAAVRRECWYCFPRCTSALSAHRALSRLPGVSRRFCEQRHHPGSAAASIWYCFGPSSRNVRRILSIEPLISGAGKEAAYDEPERSVADYVGTRPERSAPSWRARSMKASPTREMLRRESMSSVYANGSGALRSATARPKRTRWRLGSNVGELPWTQEHVTATIDVESDLWATVVQKIRRESLADALIRIRRKAS
jgi:hypothetical protein